MRFALLCTAALTKRAGKSGGKGKVQKPAFAKAHYGQSSKWSSWLGNDTLQLWMPWRTIAWGTTQW